MCIYFDSAQTNPVAGFFVNIVKCEQDRIIEKKKLRVASRGLKWENKTYKLKKPILLWRLARFLVSGPEFHSTALLTRQLAYLSPFDI